MTRVPSPRRRERPRRLVAALALLSVSTLAAVVALLVGSEAALSLTVAGVVVLAWAAARLGHDQIVDERHQHADERVAQAQSYRALFLERSAEHALFASRMGDRLLATERRSDVAGRRADEAERRVAALRPELIDELAAWDAVDPVTELLDWERRTRVPQARRRTA
jgi:hypothetical protein